MAQSPKRVLKKLGEDPLYFIDSVNVDKSEVLKYDSKDIGIITVVKKDNAIKLLGEDGKDGAIYIETKIFVKSRYWKFFSSKSKEYSEIVKSPENDTTIQYILNKRILENNFEGDLALIDNKIFKSITIINKQELIDKYNIYNKEFGVIIISEVPDDLYKGRKKF